MIRSDKIHTAIIDDDEDFIFELREHLGFFPEIEIQGCASKYHQARNMLLRENLDLVFMDIEMPVKSGFELLEEIRKVREQMFSVVFYTAYDKYLIQGLRESAFDYILKPVKHDELKIVIERYKNNQKNEISLEAPPSYHLAYEIISLPTPIGLRFMDKNNILLFQYSKELNFDKPAWKVLMTDMSELRLRTGTNAKEIIEIMGKRKFIQVNQSTILNLNYLASIEYKTRDCLLIPPFNRIKMVASRTHLHYLRNIFETL